MIRAELDTMVAAYIEAMLWSTSDYDADESGDQTLDATYSDLDIAPESMKRIEHDCAVFYDLNAKDLKSWEPDQVGYDFWMERSGSGVGFRDRSHVRDSGGAVRAVAGFDKAGAERLSRSAHEFGEQDVVVGDDRKLYVEGGREVKAPPRTRPIQSNLPSYKTNDPKGWGGDPKRGAAMGRGSSHGDPKKAHRFLLKQVHLDAGGYDPNGTYFGARERGEYLYSVISEDESIDYVLTASNREDAKRQVRAKYPKARFFS